jgi:very-short-patch-repair endonuclease
MERKLHRPEKRDIARRLRREQTDIEKKLWGMLRSRSLLGYKFRRQYSVGPFIVDFCCPAQKLVIELDGGQHTDRSEYDAQRTTFLESKGFRVLRFWNHDMLQKPQAVAEKILSELLKPLTPTLSPARGEGA